MSDNKELIHDDFFKNNEIELLNNIKKRIESGNVEEIQSDNMILGINKDYKIFLKNIRESVNQKFLIEIEKQQLKKKNELQQIINKKNKEIKDLTDKLNSLVISVKENSIKMKNYDSELKITEENIKKISDEAQFISIPELISERHINRILKNFMNQLNDIKSDIQENNRNLNDAFEKTKKQYGYNIELLIESLKEKYEDILENISDQFNDKNERIKTAYDQQKVLLQKIIDNLNYEKLKLENDSKLKTRISQIFISNKELKPEKIMIRAGKIEQMDVLERHKRVEEELNKFNKFSDLYGNEKLGIKALKSDLKAVEFYVEKTKLKVEKKDPIPEFREIGGANWWREPNVDMAEYKRITSIVPSAKQPYVYENYGRASFGRGWPGHYIWGDWDGRNRFINTGNQGIREINKRNLDQYNDELRRIKSIPFPSNEFNALVDQFNEFVIKI